MSVEFRQRSLAELFRMVWQRKLLILLPTLAVGISVGYVVWNLPSVYESTALLTIRPPAISNSVIRPLSDEDVSQRLNSITEEIKSRSSLEPMISKYRLFQQELNNGVPMEIIIEKMRGNIRIELEKIENDKIPAFRISYRDREPESARNVTQELADKIVNAQTESSLRESRTTQDFFEKQLAESKARLDQIDAHRLSYMLQNVDKLPTAAASLIAQLQGLREQQKTLQTEIGRQRDNRQYLERQKSMVRDIGEKEATDRERILTDPTRTPAYGELVKRKTELKAQLQNLLAQYKPKHPDVAAKQNEIETVEKEIERLKESAKTNIEEVRQATRGRLDVQVQSLENEQKRIDAEIARQETTLAQVQTALGDLQRRIDSVPNAEVALESYNREYQTLKTGYDELLKKKNDADLQTQRAENMQGERIIVVDRAQVPQVPVNAAKRPILMFFGAIAGLMLGLFFAALVEFPKLLTIQNADDAKYYTGLPVLASVPEMMTTAETRWRSGLSLMKAALGIVIAAASVPLLIFALQISHVFDRFVS
jgi:polysaccharide biosynthesis transport protein